MKGDVIIPVREDAFKGIDAEEIKVYVKNHLNSPDEPHQGNENKRDQHTEKQSLLIRCG